MWHNKLDVSFLESNKTQCVRSTPPTDPNETHERPYWTESVGGVVTPEQHDEEEDGVQEGEDDQADAVGDVGDGTPLSDYNLVDVQTRSRVKAAQSQLVEDVDQDLEYVLEHEKFHMLHRRVLWRERLICSRSLSLGTHKAPYFTS